jgi:diguanylate cyclase (GGDEF)-like protein
MKLSDLRILYVEDDTHTQEWMKMLLEDEIKELYQAYNGKEGLEFYKKYAPDIILSDINMPEMDGMSMAQKIKKIDRHQPIILLSAFSDKDTLLRAIDIGVDGFSPKPIDLEHLRNKLEDIAASIKEKAQKESEVETLYTMAHYDALTGIPNRTTFNIKLDKALLEAKKHNHHLVLFFIDLDNFKIINDKYGHLAGDVVLQTIAKNISHVIRKEDTLARIGGDEFALLIENVHNENFIHTLAQKILQATAQPIIYEGHKLQVSCSIGISRYPEDAHNKKELFEQADKAMYNTKKSGKSNFTYSSHSQEQGD